MVEKMDNGDIQVETGKPMVSDLFGWLGCLIQNQEAEVRLMQQQQQQLERR